jgi:hypothetical protein
MERAWRLAREARTAGPDRAAAASAGGTDPGAWDTTEVGRLLAQVRKLPYAWPRPATPPRSR